jgi:hypothetical protein
MAKSAPNSQNQQDSTPAQMPQITPQAYAASDHGFTMQTFMEIQKNLGQLSQAVVTLTDESKKIREVLEGVSKDIHAAKVSMKIIWGILTIVGGIVVVLFWKIWDAILPLIHIKPHP